MNPRLVDDDVRHLGQILFDVVDLAAPGDVFGIAGVRFPESDLVDAVGLLYHLILRNRRPGTSLVSDKPSHRPDQRSADHLSGQ